MNDKRKKAETLVYKVMDALDKTGQNSAFYKEKFAKMSDSEFLDFISQEFPFKFQPKLFEIEPKMNDIVEALDILKVPLLEKVNMPFLYENKDGIPVQSKEALVCYVPLKKMKQFITKKNSMSTDISHRDMKTGLLISDDKNGATSDREMEALAVMGMESTIEELARPRADAMTSKNTMNTSINTLGKVSLEDLPKNIDDSLAKNLLNVYMVGSLLNSNLVNQDYMLPKTVNDKQRKVERES